MAFWMDSQLYVLVLLLVPLAAAGGSLLFILVHWILVARRKDVDPGRNVRQQVVRLLITIIVLVSGVLALSLHPNTQNSAASRTT